MGELIVGEGWSTAEKSGHGHTGWGCQRVGPHIDDGRLLSWKPILPHGRAGARSRGLGLSVRHVPWCSNSLFTAAFLRRSIDQREGGRERERGGYGALVDKKPKNFSKNTKNHNTKYFIYTHSRPLCARCVRRGRWWIRSGGLSEASARVPLPHRSRVWGPRCRAGAVQRRF